MEFNNLNKEDIELIKKSMLEHSCTLTTSALECKEIMGVEAYKRDMDRADRLIYLVNVLNGMVEYDK